MKYDELNNIVDNAKNKISNIIKEDPNYFGNDSDVLNRIKTVLNNSKTISESKINTTDEIMRCVDLTILDKEATNEAVIEVAKRAAKEHCATVCVYPQHIPLVNKVMQEEGVKDVPPIAVVGFPFIKDSNQSNSTIAQTIEAIKLGAKEIDMVLPITFKDESESYLDHFNYLKSVIDVAHKEHIPVKVILETAYLTDEQIALASMISTIAGADWVKTSTGFAENDKFAIGRTSEEKGATPKAVAIMRKSVGYTTTNHLGIDKSMGVKASGGVRNKEQALAVLEAGADRIGASGGINVENTPSNKTVLGY